MMNITLYQEQLKHTIRQVLHRAGANVNDETLRAYVQMDESVSDEQLIQRLIQTGVAKVKTILRDHLENKEDSGTDVLVDPESWLFSIDLDGDGQSLANLLHWFVVWWALKGILPAFGLTGLASDADAEIKNLEAEIEEELIELSMPIKDRRTIEYPTDFAPIIELI